MFHQNAAPPIEAPKTPSPQSYITDAEAARFLSLSPGWMRQLRLLGGGPRYSKLGRAVRYRFADLIAWAEERSTSCTSEKA